MTTEPEMVLLMNDMRSDHFEILRHVARGTAAELQAFVSAETVDFYRDGRWAKVFRKGGPLEWYNKLTCEIVPFAVPPHVNELTASEGLESKPC